MRSTGLPENPHRIASDLWIRSHHREAASQRLTDQDAIERIAMQRRQARELQDGVLVEWQRGDATRGPLRRDVPLRWFRQWEAPEPVLDRDLPDRHRTQ